MCLLAEHPDWPQSPAAPPHAFVPAKSPADGGSGGTCWPHPHIMLIGPDN